MKAQQTLTALFKTGADPAQTVLRLSLGGVMFAHGAQKLLGWFGGPGFDGTMGFFTEALGLPALVGFLVIVVEFFAGVALLIGLGGRLAALGSAAIMVGAIALVHGTNGFFMNWFGNQAGEGFEFHLLVLAMAAVVALRGSGAWSADRWLATRI